MAGTLALLSDADLLETFSHFLSTEEACRLSRVARDINRTLKAAFNREKPLRYWSRKEGTRHGPPLSLSTETCWADAFTVPPVPVPAAPAPAPGAAGNEAHAEGNESDDPDEPLAPDVPAAAPAGPDATAQLQLPVATVRLSQELPAPPAFLEVALTEALPELIGQRIDSAVRSLLGSPAWPQEAHGFWATAFLGIVLSEGGQGVNKLLAWLWRHSAPSAIGIAEKPGYGASVPMLPSPSSQRSQHLQQRSELLNRYHVREFACAVLVLLRHKAVARTQPRNVLPAAHDMLCNELVHLEAQDLHSAVRIMQSVPQWRLDGLPLPARSVVLPGGATLTAEQISIIQSVVPFDLQQNGGVIYDRPVPNVIHRIQAFAGCGKTSTLKAIAEAHTGLRFLYTAYNKDVVASAASSFPNNCEVKTTHSLAFADYGRPLQDKLKPSVYNSDIQAAVMRTAYSNSNKKLAVDAAECLKTTLERFMTSADDAVADHHVPANRPRYNDPAKDHNWVQLAQGLFGLMTDPHDRMPCTHNAYLKLCQLKRPLLTKWVNGAGKVPYDVILVDEAQDLNEVTIDLLLRQPGTKVLVGDRHQHVYSFNHCANALDRQFVGGRVFQLSCSFRMGPEVNALVNRILRTAKEERRLVLSRGNGSSVVYVPDGAQGFRQVPLLSLAPSDTADTPLRLEAGPAGLVQLPPVGPDGPPRRVCYITRSNAGWLHAAISLAERGNRIFLTAGEGPRKYIALFTDLEELHKFKYQGRRGKFASWARTWEELKSSPRTKNESLKSAIKIVDFYGASILQKIELVKSCRVFDKDEAAYILSTAHKMKGLEEEVVQLADDFLPIAAGRGQIRLAGALQQMLANGPAVGMGADGLQGLLGEPEEDEYNLVYVAASRSLKVLVCNDDLADLVSKMQLVSERVQTRSRDALRSMLRAEQAHAAQLEAEEQQMEAEEQQLMPAGLLNQMAIAAGMDVADAMEAAEAQAQQVLAAAAAGPDAAAAVIAALAGAADMELDDEDGAQAPGGAAPAQQLVQQMFVQQQVQVMQQQQQQVVAAAQEEPEIARPEERTFACPRCRSQFVPVERAALDVVCKERLLCEACVKRSMYCSLWGLPPGRSQRLSM